MLMAGTGGGAGGTSPGGPYEPPHATTPRVDAARLWAGAAATAVVAALVALVSLLVISIAFDVKPVGPNWLLGDSKDWTLATRFAVTAAVAALLAAGLLHVLLLTTPRPRAFWGTIVALATVTAAVTPFAVSGSQSAQIATSVTAALVGIVIGALLSSVADRATSGVA
jgi:hypothetical protein